MIDEIDCGHDAILEFLLGRDTDVTQHRAGELGEEAFDEVEPRTVGRCEDKLETPRSLSSEPAAGLFGDVRGVIVEDHLDRGMSWVGDIEKPEKLDELAAPVAIRDEGVDLAGEQVDASQQADGTVALVLMIAGDSRMNAGHRRQV